MRRVYMFLSFVIPLLLFSGTLQAQFKVIGYFPTYSNYPNGINSMDLAKITHLNIAFANPDASGNLIPSNGTNANVTTVVNACHAKGVKVFMSIGGGAASGTNYSSLLSNSTNINNFVTKIVSYATTYNLDGIDVDIEGNILNGSTITAAQYQSFVTALATGLHAQNKLMSSALATWFANYVTNTAAAQFDWINLMSYDAYGPWTGPGQHSPYSLAVSDFQYWNQNKAVPASKLVVGVPFYGYGWGTYANQGITYCTIVNNYPGAESKDQIGAGNDVIYYNGIATIKQKTNYALQNAAGIMIWELTQDCATSDSRSLLLAISQAIAAYAQAPTIVFNNSTATYGDAAFTVSANSNSTGAITYSIISGSQYASITSAGKVSILGAGTVTIQASQAAATGYAAGTKTSTLTISKAALTATAANKTKVYNTANPALTITYSGFKYSDNNTSITAPTISTTAVQGSNVGSYPISLSGGSAANYTITLVNGTLTVTQATPTLSYTGATTGPSGGTINLTATSNSPGTISYGVATGTGTASLYGNTLSLTQAGTVTLTVNLAATLNYTSKSVQQTITITQTTTAILSSTVLAGSLKVYPNPMNDNGYIELTLEESVKGSLELCDINGKVLKVIADGMLTMQSDYAISLNEFPQGIYILKLSTEKGTLVKKINK